MLQFDADIRRGQKGLGHTQVKTPLMHTHVLNWAGYLQSNGRPLAHRPAV